MVGGFQNPLEYDVERLREVADIDDPIDKIETPDPTHECQVCGWLEEVDDYQKHTPNWCESCESVQTFVRLNTE